MSDQSANLSLPYLLPAQAQKHVTHNEAIRRLDTLVQLVLVSCAATTPPPAPVEGEAHGLGPAPSSDWAGQAHHIAIREGGAWVFVAPRPGWRAFDMAGGVMRLWDGTAWAALPAATDNLAGIGIQTGHDAVNRLAVASPATLLTHAGAGHQLKINKAAASYTASLLFQSNWSGRAEMGLAGNDDFAIKVSSEGSSWTEALRIARITGLVSGSAVQSSGFDLSEAGRLTRVDGALAASLASHGGYYGAAAGRNINNVTAGDCGLYHDGNPGSWPVTPYGGFWWLTTQRMYNDPAGACIQNATLYTASGTPSAQSRHFRIRAHSGAAWGPWERIVTQRNLLGPVSQAAGVPTGAVIERGSNANGGYTRFADGTLIMTIAQTTTLDIATAEGVLFRSASQALVFPASQANSAMAALHVTVDNAAHGGIWTGFSRVASSSGGNYYLLSGASRSAYEVAIKATIIGRWY